ncbi:hypothetical protein GOP47_0018037 [Adiantum capillus-veneris]|uniref:DUF4378 domain-containing protein n=1 Tax=Adiantum capillus-veneris TaxID=13818 RepID=A0A9D4ZA95_ADICA|nr:hypothetical protein GOP47_0018037 [Adiantum capillus-veneris]
MSAAMLRHSHSTRSTLLPTFSSTSSTCSSDHHNLGKGSCTGLFFQLFDWNGRLHKKQRLRRKSLPAERPASPLLREQNRECTKAPADQNLNINDLRSPPRNPHKHHHDPLQREHTPPEKKKKKRSPNVVAKLMGLETMPSPDFRREKWDASSQHHQSPLQLQNYEERSLLSRSRIPSSRRSLLQMGSGTVDKSSSRWASVSPCLSQDPSSLRYHDDVLHNNVYCDEVLGKESASALPPSASPFQDCKIGCILSPSQSQNKLTLPVKSPLASKARACLFEAANRILEPNRQLRVAFSESADGNNENDNENTARKELKFKQATSATASSCLHRRKTIPSLANGGSYGSASTSNVARSKQRTRSCSAVAENNEEAATTRRFNRGGGTHEDVDSAKCYQNQSGTRYGKKDKGKLGPRRQEQTCRELDEGTSAKVQNAPPAIGKRECSSQSSSKIRGTLPEHRDESQGAASSTSSMCTPSSTNINSSAMIKNRGISSSQRANIDKKNMMFTNQDMPKTEPLSRRNSASTRGAGVLSSQGHLLKSRGVMTASTSSGNSSISQRSYSGKESVCTDEFNHMCEDDHPAESLSCNIKSSSVVDDVSILHQNDGLFSSSVEITNDDLRFTKFSNHSRVQESGCGGSCVTSVEEMTDTATSCGIDYSHKRKQTVSYSGKSTATILQELLSALNRSARPLMVENDDNSELSGITSRTIQTGECRKMEERNEEDCFNSYIDEEEGSGSISNREDLSLSICKVSQQCTRLDTLNCAQERQVQSSDSEPNRRKGELVQKVMPEFAEHVFQSEEDYVKCIVQNSNLTPQHEWRSSRKKSLVDPALFEELETTATHDWALQEMPEIEIENWSALSEEWYSNLMRCHRKLVFDCVQEALNLDVGFSQHPTYLSTTPDLECLQSRIRCERVMKHLDHWRGIRCGMNVDDLVEKAMNTGAGKWDDFSDEFSGIAEKVGHMLINDLIEEIVLDLRSSHKQPLNGRSMKEVLERNVRKPLIWVGL